jgi:glycosyltransferase involved in cell wall biosynthesis
MGHEVDLVLMQLGDYAYANEIDPRVRIVDLKVRRMRASMPAFWRYLRHSRPDVVISAGNLAHALAACATRFVNPRPMLILTNHHAVSAAFGHACGLGGWMRMRLQRIPYRFADGIVGVSEGVSEHLRRIPGVKPDRVQTIYNPSWTPEIESRSLEPVACGWLSASDSPLILAAGRLDVVKDYPSLLKAFAVLRNRRHARLLILGEGSLEAELRSMVENLGISQDVLMPGFVENPFAYMARASVFVLSSLNEALPTVLIEAMACGTPVVSTDCPTGPAEILDRGRYGELVPVGDSEAMAAAMGRQLDQPTEPDMLRARAREFSIDVSANAYLRLIDRIRRQHG